MGCLKLTTEHYKNLRQKRLKNRLALNKTTKKAYSYFCARYYDPRTSLWLSVDPPMLNDGYLGDYTITSPRERQENLFNNGVFNPSNLSVYSYTWNNPVNLTDPTGMGSEECPTCHTVKKDENLSTIEKQNNWKPGTLTSLNPQIKDPSKIDVGQQIVTPNTDIVDGIKYLYQKLAPSITPSAKTMQGIGTVSYLTGAAANKLNSALKKLSSYSTPVSKSQVLSTAYKLPFAPNTMKAMSTGLGSLSKGLGLFSLTITAVQWSSGQISGTRAIFDGAMGLIGIWGGPWGAGISMVYFTGMYLYETYYNNGKPAF